MSLASSLPGAHQVLNSLGSAAAYEGNGCWAAREDAVITAKALI